MTRRNLPIPTLTPEDEARLWAKVQRGADDECWEWQGCRYSGYGRINIGGRHGRLYRVTRLVYFLEHGVDPGEQFVCHSCDNPSCCNPNHLWLGDDAANRADCESKGRANHPKGETHGLAKLTEVAVLSLRASDEDNCTLARRYGVTDVAVSGVRRGRTWKHVGGEIKLRPPGRPKLTKNDVLAIRTSDETNHKLAKRYRVSDSAIGKARRGKTWKHVGGKIKSRPLGRPKRRRLTTQQGE